MSLQIVLMACEGRPRMLQTTLERLEGAGRLLEVDASRRIYYGSSDAMDLLEVAGWPCFWLSRGEHILEQFQRMILEADPTKDLLFIEDDVWVAEGAIPAIAAMPFPEGVGVLSFFDYHNLFATPGIHVLERGKPFWGSQCLKLSAAVVRQLQTMKPARQCGWDVWMGRACEAADLSIAMHVPNLVQHMGTEHSVFAPLDAARPSSTSYAGAPPPRIVETTDPRYCAKCNDRHLPQYAMIRGCWRLLPPPCGW